MHFASIRQIIIIYLQVCSCTGISVQTKSGAVKGWRSPISPKVTRFLGIPYANPPRRFERANLVSSWNGTIGGYKSGAICFQGTSTHNSYYNESEDCLTLDIYSSANFYGNGSVETNKDVMVYIHGGGFLTGGSSYNEGSELSSFGDVVLVLIQYRLGLFGFLYTKGLTSSSLGLWDQKLALEWVKQNIKYFGGNENKITIFGESAGSISVACHILSPYNSRKDFQRAIMESGSYFTLPPYNPLQDTLVQMIASRTSCQKATSELDIVSCLKNLDTEELVTAYRQTISRGVPFYPTTDSLKEFLPHSWLKMAMNYKRNDIKELRRLVGHLDQYDTLMGFNKQEGLLFSVWLPFTADMLRNGISKQQYADFTRKLDYLYYVSNQTGLVKKLVDIRNNFYMNKTQDKKFDQHQKNLLNLIDMLGDTAFGIPTVMTAIIHKLVSWNTKTYLYMFDDLVYPYSKGKWIKQGAGHGEELSLVFGYPLRSGGAARDVSVDMIKYWINFAKTGNPNEPTWTSNRSRSHWGEFNSNDYSYLRIKQLEDFTSTGLKQKETQLFLFIWTMLLDSKSNECEKLQFLEGADKSQGKNSNQTRCHPDVVHGLEGTESTTNQGSKSMLNTTNNGAGRTYSSLRNMFIISFLTLPRI